MNLGELEFSAEDFQSVGSVSIPDQHFQSIDISNLITELANRILCEKLAKAPEMFCRKDTWSDGSHMLWAADECPYFSRAKYRARLVCIEELPK